LRVLEERPVLEDLLTRTIMTSGVGGVQVLIGGEGTWEDLSQCSIVLARYGTPGLASGTLGVLGPMRMPYSRTISTVRFISSLLTDLVTETLNA
jgi:heat-inducible transcriptional repressor